ncbi:MAG: hypothetical protein QM503_00405 [Bacteroidota bacterium]
MFKKSILISIIILFSGLYQLSGQVYMGPDYKNLDSITYAHYVNQEWDKVVKTGNKALNRNIDYFYLRMRLGIASYYLGKYSDAADHFEKALIFNSKDQTAQLYLYDTYILLGKNTKAYRLSSDFNKKTQSLIPIKRKPVEAVYAGGGFTFSNNIPNNDELFIDTNNDTLTGYRILIGDKSVYYAGVNFNLSPTVSLYAGYNHLQIQKQINFQYNEAPLKLDSIQREDWGFQKFYSTDTTLFQKSFSETIDQSEIYLNSRFQFENGWAATVFSNLVMVRSVNIKTDTIQNSVTDTSYYVYGNEPEFNNYTYDELQFTRKDSSFFNYVIGINIEKDYNNITLNLTATTSGLNGLIQNQLGFSGFYYINPYSTFYGSTGITWFVQKWESGWKENRLILNQKLGGKLFRNIWGEAEITYGNLNNSNTNNALVIYNQADGMNLKAGLTLNWYIGKHFELSLLYRYTSYEGLFMEVPFDDNDNNTNINKNTFNYQTQSLFGGLKWRF